MNTFSQELAQYIIGCLLGLGVSVSLIALILTAHRHYNWASRKEELHHTHKSSIPRFGGIALVAAFVSVVILLWAGLGKSFAHESACWKIVALSLAMFGLGLRDDFRPLGAKCKLTGQLLIASAAYFLGINIHTFQISFLHHSIDLGMWSWLVTVFWLVAMTNLVNLIDGVDGLAGGICLMLMLLLASVGFGADSMSFIAAGMAGALLGFLWFNFPPARIYMGDGGAYFLGFLIGSMTIVNSQKGTIFSALIAPLFVLALPILDTTLAILRRGLRGLPLFRPDRRHIHHHLLERGASHKKVVLGLYIFTAFFLLLGFAAFWWHGQHLPILLGVGTLALLVTAGKCGFSRKWFNVGRVVSNSLAERSEIHYAICHSNWLAMEGARSRGIENLSEDVAFIARKLGFARVQIRLEDGEKIWQLVEINEEDCQHYQHQLPGHRYCFLNLSVPCQSLEGTMVRDTYKAEYETLSELLAEGWIKAVAAWEKQHQLPIRFDRRMTPVRESRPREIFGVHAEV
jgi:UDP-GlcNAc:undecaprenyl-phosphate GlcNAc-1-phosphate transferase